MNLFTDNAGSIYHDVWFRDCICILRPSTDIPYSPSSTRIRTNPILMLCNSCLASQVTCRAQTVLVATEIMTPASPSLLNSVNIKMNDLALECFNNFIYNKPHAVIVFISFHSLLTVMFQASIYNKYILTKCDAMFKVSIDNFTLLVVRNWRRGRVCKMYEPTRKRMAIVTKILAYTRGRRALLNIKVL